jgi:hypothetical protein
LPLSLVFGLASWFLSLFLFWSLSISLIYKYKMSECGMKCGYWLERSDSYNGFDSFMMLTSMVRMFSFCFCFCFCFGSALVWCLC